METRPHSVCLVNYAMAILYVLFTKKGNKKSKLRNSWLWKSLQNNAYIQWKNDLFYMWEEKKFFIIFAFISLLGFVLKFNACAHSAEDHWSWHCVSQVLKATICADMLTVQVQIQRYKYWACPLFPDSWKK